MRMFDLVSLRVDVLNLALRSWSESLGTGIDTTESCVTIDATAKLSPPRSRLACVHA